MVFPIPGHTGFSSEMMTEVKCGYDGCESGTSETEACWPIPIPEEDPDYLYNRCHKFVRSQEVPVLSCTFGECREVGGVVSVVVCQFSGVSCQGSFCMGQLWINWVSDIYQIKSNYV